MENNIRTKFPCKIERNGDKKRQELKEKERRKRSTRSSYRRAEEGKVRKQ